MSSDFNVATTPSGLKLKNETGNSYNTRLYIHKIISLAIQLATEFPIYSIFHPTPANLTQIHKRCSAMNSIITNYLTDILYF